MKVKNLRDLKEILNKLSEKDLDGNLIAIGYSGSGSIHTIEKSKENIYLHDDEILTEMEMEEFLSHWGDTKKPEPYIKKGELLFKY